MCYFVFIGVPAEEREAIESVFAAIQCDIGDVSNPSVRALFPPRVDVVTVTHCGCSCDLVATGSATFDEDAERRRYRKKGWSDSKIEAAIRAKRPHERPVFGAFRSAIVDLARRTSRIYLLTHTFQGDIRYEEVPACRSVTMTIDHYLNRGGAYDEDILILLQGGQQGSWC
jgi:hypothetical protein